MIAGSRPSPVGHADSSLVLEGQGRPSLTSVCQAVWLWRPASAQLLLPRPPSPLPPAARLCPAARLSLSQPSGTRCARDGSAGDCASQPVPARLSQARPPCLRRRQVRNKAHMGAQEPAGGLGVPSPLEGWWARVSSAPTVCPLLVLPRAQPRRSAEALVSGLRGGRPRDRLLPGRALPYSSEGPVAAGLAWAGSAGCVPRRPSM